MSLRVERGPVTTLTIDRPQVRNALDDATITALHAALDDLAGVRVVVLTGEGGVFCSGADLSKVMGSPEGRRAVVRDFARLAGRLGSLPVPVVARLNGHCLAGGMGLLLACDLAICVDDASFFLPEAAVGMWPMMVGAMLNREVPRKRALELALTGRKLSAAEALDWGLVNEVVPRGGLDAAVAALCEKIVARSPTALRMGRRAWRDAMALPLDAGLEQLAEALGDLMETEDAVEGFLAFAQKRAPNWKDR